MNGVGKEKIEEIAAQSDAFRAGDGYVEFMPVGDKYSITVHMR